VQNWGIRLFNYIRFQTDSDLGQGLYWKPANDGTTLRIYGSTYSAGVGYLQLNVQSGNDGLVVNGGARTLAISAAQTSIALNLNNIIFNTHGTGEAARIVNSSKNFLIGTTTDAGFRLDVNGTARVKGAGTTSVTSSFTVLNSANTTILNVRDDNAVVVGKLVPDEIVFVGSTNQIRVNGTSNFINQYSSGTVGAKIQVQNGQNIHIAPSTTGGNTLVVEGVGSFPTSINNSSILQVNSTTQGVLISRMTSAQRTAIASPATGLLVYQTDGVEGFYVYSGGSWKSLTMTTI
jgi:hypothetical protein